MADKSDTPSVGKFWQPDTPGRFIVLDGLDGCGKTTQLDLLAKRLTAEGRKVVRAIDPGGTSAGDEIRRLLLSPATGELDPRTEACLYMASRAQLMAEVVLPALKEKQIVLCDRFASATVAYQGYGGEIEPAQIVDMAETAIRSRWPHLTVVLLVDPELGLSRIKGGKDRMESKDLAFHQRVHDGFRALGGVYPSPVVYVDADAAIDQVADRVWKAVADAIR